MCRLLVMLGGVGEVRSYRGALLESLVRASEFDPYGGFITGYRGISHGDGWGSLRILITQRGVETLVFSRSLRPIYQDGASRAPAVEIEADGGAAVEMIHARAASSGMPINIFSTHPAQALTSEGYLVYVIHNGTVDKERILEVLGVEKGGRYAELYNDTQFLAQLVASRVRGHIGEEVLREAIEYTRTALNIGIALVKDGEAEVVVGSFYRVPDRPIERRNYYRIYRASLGGRFYAYMSSTPVDIYRPEADLEWVEVPNGVFEGYRVRYEDGPKIERLFSISYPH